MQAMENLTTTEEPKTEPKTESKSEIRQFFDDIQTEKYRPYKTGLSFFDSLLYGGLMRQTVTLILAAPGAGKTALCAQIAEAIAQNGRPVAYINLEMSKEQMLARSISSKVTQAGIPMTAIDILQGYKWKDDPKKRDAIEKALQEYETTVYPYMRYKGDGKQAELDGISKYLKSVGEKAKANQQEAPAIILDYLHLINDTRKDEAQTIKATLQVLKDYAIQYDTVCIAISATNRDSNKKGYITEASGRDSSGIEYSGDNIISLNFYECELPDRDPEKVNPTDVHNMSKLKKRSCRRMTLRVLKGRFIPPGRDKRVYFLASSSRFYAEDEFIPIPDDEKIPFATALDWDAEIEDDGHDTPEKKKRGRKKKDANDDII